MAFDKARGDLSTDPGQRSYPVPTCMLAFSTPTCATSCCRTGTTGKTAARVGGGAQRDRPPGRRRQRWPSSSSWRLLSRKRSSTDHLSFLFRLPPCRPQSRKSSGGSDRANRFPKPMAVATSMFGLLVVTSLGVVISAEVTPWGDGHQVRNQPLTVHISGSTPRVRPRGDACPRPFSP